MLSRRQFIRQAGLATGAVLVSAQGHSSFFIGRKPTVLIIGAGFAGLAAALALHRKGISSVILEARNRIGGRVFSYPIDPAENLVIELGAEWVGQSHTRIQELCGEFELPLTNNQLDTHLIYKGAYHRKGEWDYSDSWKKKFQEMMEQYKHLSDKQKEEIDRIDWWRYLVNNGCEGRDLDLRELLDSTDFGESIRHVSAFAALAEYAESSEKNEMDLKIKGGNGQLAERIADRIGRENIRLQHRVTRIVQNRQGVKVYCDNGQEFAADKLICTAPTFAAKKIKWEPGLPEAQLQAMNELQYARINKNPLLFTNRFWKDEAFDLVSDQLPHYFYHATKEQASSKGVLISYTIGDKAAVVANQDEAWRTAAVQQTLGPHLGNVTGWLEKQVNYYWGNDEFSHGAYAMYGTGQWFGLMPKLRKKHMHTYFAGEHLADWQGFMEGAINSGEEAAEMVK